MNDLSTGQAKLAWVRPRMPLLARIRQRFLDQKPLAGERIAMSIHLEAKTAVLAELLAQGGAEVAITSSNPLSAQDDVALALAESGVLVHARRGTDMTEFDRLHHAVLDIRPTLILDDGGELLARLVTTRQTLADGVKGGGEETTTGVTRIRALAREGRLPFAMVAVNDAPMKHLFDNRYGTGQSTWEGIMRATNVSVAGARIVVAGYGYCGRGIAERARGLGGHVTVTEVDPIRANEAWMDGFRITTMEQAVLDADFVVTATGCRDVVGPRHFAVMKHGVVLANAGHFDIEVDLEDLRQKAIAVVAGRTEDVIGYRMQDGRVLYVLAEGRLVNLAAGDGHPIEIMDLTFALQALTLESLGREPKPPGVYSVDPGINRWVAETRLETLGLTIDRLTDTQQRYLSSW